MEDFSLDGYVSLLRAICDDYGYAWASFLDAEPLRGKRLLLRHDLDMSIGAGVKTARLEAEIGARATYFVLLRTEMYNPFSRRGQDNLREIIGLGHTVGLHFDASLYGDTAEEVDRAVKQECAVLESIVERPVEIVSFHRPASMLQGLDRRVGGRRHTYEPLFFKDIGYCSDSRGGWYHGHPLGSSSIQDGSPMQLLTHPLWWDAHASETVRQKLDRFALSRFDLLRAELAANCQTYPQAFRGLGPL